MQEAGYLNVIAREVVDVDVVVEAKVCWGLETVVEGRGCDGGKATTSKFVIPRVNQTSP